MAMPLAKQVDCRMDAAMDIASATSIRVVKPKAQWQTQVLATLLMPTTTSLGRVPVANFWLVSPLPREPLALDDYRWDLLTKGTGPNNLVAQLQKSFWNSFMKQISPNDIDFYDCSAVFTIFC